MSGALDLIKQVANVALVAVAFSVGLDAATASSKVDLKDHARIITRGLVAVLLGVPLIALVLIAVLRPPDPISAGLLVAAVSVGPVAALKRAGKPDASRAAALVLNVLLMCVGLIYVPIAVALLSRLYDREVSVSLAEVAAVIVPLQLLPLLLGLAVARFAPALTRRFARPVRLIANTLLGLVALVAVVALARPIVALGPFALGCVALLALLAASLGRLLGGRSPAERTQLAAFCALRFPPLAFLLTALTAHPRQTVAVVAAYVLASLLGLGLTGAIDRLVTGGRTPAFSLR